MSINWPQIQDKWQAAWSEANLGKATIKKNQPKFFMIFAYPGISGFLHVGHMRGFSYTDAICRYERLNGKEVIFPVGTHASGNQAIAFANKVRNKDPDWIKYLEKNGCPKEKISQLTEPQAIIKYFNNVYVNEYWKKFGFLCDWGRFTCTTSPDYEKFIQWQFKKLQEKDLLIQKPYFATSCIVHGPVAVDPSETDISKGGNAEKNEYTLLKFKYGDDFLVAATLRPETIYGQTNLWINPDAKYVRVVVEGENWIMSMAAAEKLRYQKDDVLLKENVNPLTLIGQTAKAPGINTEIIILPATFCNPNVGSGIVTSVPSDAPNDYVALKELQESPTICEKYNLDPLDVQSIKLIPIIKSKGFGDFPAKEIVEKLGISSLADPNLEIATKDIYKAGFHTGVMRNNCGEYESKTVEEAKELIKAKLLEDNLADIFHDLSEEVICRCGSPVIIKRIDDQWFIRYSDPELTERSKEQAKEMKIYPQEYQDNLPSILDWFSDRACARLGNWLGSKFPFDDKWTVEPISDSTLYPAYYIVSKFVNNNRLTVNDLTEEFFDFVFLGKSADIEKEKLWKPIQEEFDYFYPLDLNLGGKEHKTVHFPVFLMNHVAILPEDKWPLGIFANWWVTGKGSKISKSKGGAEPIPEAMEKYGVDAMRLYYAHIGSPHHDVVWDENVVLNYKNSLEKIYYLITDLKKSESTALKGIDTWLLSKLQHHLKSIKSAMETYQLRDLASIVYFHIYEDVRWYSRRGGQNKNIIKEITTVWAHLMNPLTPHFSEELCCENSSPGASSSSSASSSSASSGAWSLSSSSSSSASLISSSTWPEIDSERINLTAQSGEELIKKTMEGMRNVSKLAKLQPKNFQLFVAENWLYTLFTILSQEIKVTRNVGEIMRKILEIPGMKVKGKEITKIVTSVLKDPSKLPHLVTSQEHELLVLEEAKIFLSKEFNCSIEIINANESDTNKAKSAFPGKVGILAE
jgi:leucyl-tRNA synthetase